MTHATPALRGALQASAEAQKIITELVVAATKGVSPIVDLFAGIGTYSFPMCERARVHAVENNGPMIDHIRSISPKVSVQKRDLFLNPLTAEEPHEIIFKRQEEPGGTRITLPSSTSA